MSGLADKGLVVTIEGRVKQEETAEAAITLGGLLDTALGEWGVASDERTVTESVSCYSTRDPLDGTPSKECRVMVRAEVVW